MIQKQKKHHSDSHDVVKDSDRNRICGECDYADSIESYSKTWWFGEKELAKMIYTIGYYLLLSKWW